MMQDMDQVRLKRSLRAVAGLGMALLALAGQAQSKPTQPKTAPPPAKVKPYPLKTCVVSGEQLGEMGKPHSFAWKKREIQLCCKGCLKEFKKEPAKYVQKLAEAEQAAASGKGAAGHAHEHPAHAH